MWRRIKVIPSEATIPDAEQDKRLPEDLAKELSVLRDERGAV
jgi:phage/plasmid-associated DNA primase